MDHSEETKFFEAVWTLRGGPLDDEQTATELFVAIGRVRHVEPARYELNRRRRWRDYDGRRLMVDLVTQRTQLVTIAEDRPVDEGGTLVVVTTGKQGEPPRASAQWTASWPPSAHQLEQWRTGVERGFAELELASFVMRVGDDPQSGAAGGDVRLAATSEPGLVEAIDDVVADRGHSFGGGGIVGRSFFDDEPPEQWNRLWDQR